MRRNLISLLIVFGGFVIAGSFLLSSNFGDAKLNAALLTLRWTEETGAGVSIPACGSASNSAPTCSSGSPSVTLTWADGGNTEGVTCATVRIITWVVGQPISTGVTIASGLPCNGSYTWTGGASNTSYNYSVVYQTATATHQVCTGGTDSKTGVCLGWTTETLTYTYPRDETLCTGGTDSKTGVCLGWTTVTNPGHLIAGASFATPNCYLPPTATLTASLNPVAYNTPSNLTWTVGGGPATSCTASGAWSGAKSTSGGTESTGPLTSVQTYTIQCTGPGGTSAPSSVTVNVSAPPLPSTDIKVNNSDGPIAISSGASVNVTWCYSAPGTPCANATSCTVTFSDAGGSWSGTSGNQTQPLYTTRTYTLACTGPGGSASDTATVNVSSPTLSVSLSANPNNQPAPLTTTLTADVAYTGNPADTINYSVWWNCNDPTPSVSAAESACGALPAASPGTCVAGGNGGKCNAVTFDPMSNFVPTYTANATAKVIAERGSLQAQDQEPIAVTFTGGSCSASPTSVAAGQPVTWTATTPSGGSGSYTYLWHGSAPLEGLTGNPVQAIYITTGTKTGNVDISDGIQTVNRACTTSVTVAPAILNFNAVPTIISRGQSSTLFSSTAGFSSCTITASTGSNPGSVNPDGSGQRTVSPSQTTTYTLTCNPGNATAQATVTVRGVPGFIEIPP